MPHTIRSIPGSAAHSVVVDHVENGAHVYTVRTTWPGEAIVLEKVDVHGQHVALRIADAMSRTRTSQEGLTVLRASTGPRFRTAA